MTCWSRGGVALAVLIALSSCARSVDQHASTGPDGFFEGSEPIELVDGAGEAEGVVSYPAGDRVDWKVIDLPRGRHGTLALELEWTSPRDGLDLAFKVYDVAAVELGEAAPSRRRRARRTGDKSATIENARGRLYVLIYASERRDAGEYELSVKFTDLTPAAEVSLDEALAARLADGLVIPDPPRLSSIYAVCKTEYDPTNPDCVDNPPPCDRDRPDKKNPSCKKLCNKDKLDPKNPDCAQFYPVCDTHPSRYDATNPNCAGLVAVYPPPPPPIPVKVVDRKIWNGKTAISVAIGSKSDVKTSWKGTLVDGRGQPVAKGEFTIVRIEGKNALGTVELSLDAANAYQSAIIYYPDDYVAPTTP